MKVVFLASATSGLRWFSLYYRSVFPEGSQSARKQMAIALTVLSENPRIGRRIPETEYREFVVPRTPFTLIYRIGAMHIEILRLWDARANPDARDLPNPGTSDQ